MKQYNDKYEVCFVSSNMIYISKFSDTNQIDRININIVTFFKGSLLIILDKKKWKIWIEQKLAMNLSNETKGGYVWKSPCHTGEKFISLFSQLAIAQILTEHILHLKHVAIICFSFNSSHDFMKRLAKTPLFLHFRYY